MTGLLAGIAAAAMVVVVGRPGGAERLHAVTVARSSPPSAGGVGPLGPLAGVLGVTAALVGVPVPVVIAVVVGIWLLERLRRQRASSREQAARAAATIEVTFGLADELRAGRTPDQALAALAAVSGPLQDALRAVASAAAVGADPVVELARTARLPGAERLGSVAAAWSVARAAGGRVAAVLERLGRAMDDDADLRRELDAAMAGPRATMVLLALLPVLGLALAESVGAHPVALLLHRPVGWALVAGATALDLTGVFVTRAIAHAALRA
jgi:tight adherence protein B